MDGLVALVLIGTGSAGMIAVRERRLLLGALGVQWLGLLWAAGELQGVGSAGVVAEAVALPVCLGLLALTLRTVGAREADLPPSEQALPPRGGEAPEEALLVLPAGPGATSTRTQLIDALLLWAVVLTVGLAGYGLAQLYTLGAAGTYATGFYWALLSAIMSLVLDGAQDGAKLTVGLLALLNSVALLPAVAEIVPGAPLAGGLALGRIALAALLSYLWLVLVQLYGDLQLDRLFAGRSSTGESAPVAGLDYAAKEERRRDDGAGAPDLDAETREPGAEVASSSGRSANGTGQPGEVEQSGAEEAGSRLDG